MNRYEDRTQFREPPRFLDFVFGSDSLIGGLGASLFSKGFKEAVDLDLWALLGLQTIPLMTTPFTISSLVTVSLSELSTFTFSAVVFDLVTSSSSFAIVLFDDVSLETEPVLVIKLELDSECASPLFSVGGLDDDGTFTQRLQHGSAWFQDIQQNTQGQHKYL